MGIVKEFWCLGHGSFESDTPVCPHGCSIPPEREFLTPPSVHGQATRRTDTLLRQQVESFGLSNIRSSREGETARIKSPQENRAAEFQRAVRQKYPSMWGSMPKDGGAPAALAALHAEPTQGIDREALKQTARPTHHIRDPQNLKVDLTKAA